jgi:hypothetical protein
MYKFEGYIFFCDCSCQYGSSDIDGLICHNFSESVRQSEM